MEAIEELERKVKQGAVPKHVGIIMDGNGRWAEARGLPRLEGHREGSTSVREVTRSARRLGLQALTLYAFSSQNWSRPPDEVAGLMELLRDYLLKERDEIMDNGVKLNAIGELEKLPKYVKEPLDALRAESAKNQGLVLTLALSYGGREELLHAMRALAARVATGAMALDDITEEAVTAALWTNDLPPVDLVIRSSGEHRLSNFLVWQSSYAEFLFSPIAWPDFRAKEFAEALLHFQTRERRFGLTGAQLRQAGT
ncbi:MAG: di-trans,poly-cis-decaprenylcistransferase [Myxococcus sp.]|nr:di-trans,poly-cis-decaprenylcistransferase [Myxococcus sp.]